MEKSRNTLLVTWDNTEMSENALLHAIRIGRHVNNSIRLVHIVEAAKAKEGLEEIKNEFQQRLDELSKIHKYELQGIVLTGNFTKADWNGTQLNCESMDTPEGATVFDESDVVGKKPHISIIEAMNAGLKAADYVIKKDRPELASAAFEVAARALLDGISVK